MLRRSYSRPDMGYHYRPGVVERTGGSYDLAGIWRPVTFGPHTLHFNRNAYDPNLHAFYYNLEDDYYGAYGDLLEYEAALRMNHHLSEEERLRRWRMRLAFEELEDAQRLQHYRTMADTDRLLLGLSDHSWWGERYGGQPFDHRPNWLSRFGDKMRRWDSSYLPLSSTLTSRFAPVWGASVDHLARSERLLDSQLHRAQNEIYRDRYLDSERRLDYEIRNHELGNVGRRLSRQGSFLRDRLEDNILHNRERDFENRLVNDALCDQELQYERRILQDQERHLERRDDDIFHEQERIHLERRNEDMMYEQQRALENCLENEGRDRAERRLEDNIDYLRTAEVLDSDLMDPISYDNDPYPDYVERDLIADEVRSDFEEDRFERDLLY